MGDLSVESIKKYLQKPSLEEMYSSEAIIPLLLMNNSNSDKKNADSVDNQYALIDTGVVVFTGTAMQVGIYSNTR